MPDLTVTALDEVFALGVARVLDDVDVAVEKRFDPAVDELRVELTAVPDPVEFCAEATAAKRSQATMRRPAGAPVQLLVAIPDETDVFDTREVEQVKLWKKGDRAERGQRELSLGVRREEHGPSSSPRLTFALLDILYADQLDYQR